MSGPTLTPAQEIACDLDRHVAVMAGAGSGKTAVLTERYLRALERSATHPQPLRRVVAITFTEKAAAEMRERVRSGAMARRKAAAQAGDRERVVFWRRVLTELHTARISTIHAFCAAVLREFPLEAGLDPDFEIVDATEADMLTTEAVRSYLGRTARGDREQEPEVRALARVLESYRSPELTKLLLALVRTRDFATLWRRAPDEDIDAGLARLREELQARLQAVGGRIRRGVGEDTLRALHDAGERAHADKLGDRLRAVRPLVLGVLEGTLDPEAVTAVWDTLMTRQRGPRKFGNVGRKTVWGATIDGHRGRLGTLAEWVGRELGWFIPFDPDHERRGLALERDLAVLYDGVARRYEELLRDRHRIDFTGLELEVAALLEHPRVRDRVQSEIDFLLVDEFQDTNRLQWSILERVDGPNLFVVGDDKQAVYEFRGGRVEIFREVAEWIRTHDGVVVSLDDNFRALPAPIATVNAVFDRVFTESTDAPWEPDPQALVSVRGDQEPDRPGQVELLLMPRGAGRDGEADRVALRIEEMLREGTEIRDPLTGELRPVDLDDIAVVVFFRRFFSHLEDALIARGIPFHVLGGYGFYQTREVSDMIALLMTLTDSRNEIARAAVLRSPLFELSDPALWRIASTDGHDLGEKLTAVATDPGLLGRRSGVRTGSALHRGGDDAAIVARASASLGRWRQLVGRVPTATLLSNAMEETGYRAVMGAMPGGRRRLANLEKLLEIVRERESREGIRPAHLAGWLAERAAEVTDEGEAKEIETPTGVTIMTVHGSKGTQYPVVIVSEMGGRPGGGDGTPALLFHDGHQAQLGLRIPPPRSDEEHQPDTLEHTLRARLLQHAMEQRRAAETKRILYVAMTRARDHLILSTEVPREKPAARSLLAVLGTHDTFSTALTMEADGTIEVGDASVTVSAPRSVTRPGHGPDLRVSKAAVSLLEAYPDTSGTEGVAHPDPVSEPPLISVTRLVELITPDDASPSPGPDTIPPGSPPHPPTSSTGASLLRSRESGTDLGRQVHDLLATAGSDEIDDLPADVPARVRAHATAFLRSPRARDVLTASESWAEVPAVLPTPFGRLEGTLDRLYRDGDGMWTVLDYKTNRTRSIDLDRLATERGYDLQVTLYAAMAARILQLPGSERIRTVLFFTDPNREGPREIVAEHAVQDLPGPETLGRILERAAGLITANQSPAGPGSAGREVSNLDRLLGLAP